MKKIIFIILTLIPFISNSQEIKNDENLKQFIEKGIPTLNKNWTPEEYINAINKVIELSENNTLALPDNNRGKDVLFKIADYENYWFLQYEGIPDKDKMFYCIGIQKPLTQLYLKYNLNSKIVNNKLVYGNEIIFIQKTIIKLMDKMLELTDKFIIDHPNLTEIQKDGLKKVKFGLNTFISGTFIIISKEYINYLDEDICGLSKVFFDFYKKNRDTIDVNSKNEFDRNSKDINKNHNLECVKKLALIE